MNISLLTKIWALSITPASSIAMILASTITPLSKSMVEIPGFLMVDAIAFSLLSILSITSWVLYSEPLSCLLTTLIFISATLHFVILSYHLNKSKFFINQKYSSNQEEGDEDEEISQKTDTPSSSPLTPPPVANNKHCKCSTSASAANDEEQHEKFEKKWMKKCGAEEYWKLQSSKVIKEMNELRNKCIEDRREWEGDRNTLLEGLSAANKSVQLYRSLLHEFDQINTSSN